MTKEELKQYLKENLRIVLQDETTGYYTTGVRYTVKLMLEDETLSEDYITVITETHGY